MKSIYAYLYLIHKNEKEIIKEYNGKIEQYSSSLMRYVFHMLAIMIGINPEADARKGKSAQAVSTAASEGDMAQIQEVDETQADFLHANSPAPDSVDQSSLLSELGLGNHNQQIKQSPEASIEDMLKAFFGDEYSKLSQ